MKNLKVIRKARGLTQKDLAGLTGLTQATISDIERGRHRPRPSTLTLLALILNVRPREVAGELVEGADHADRPAA